ncbi:hypothetical protein TanjilG_33021 [Lupinus angustifolius]|uniref:F-box protein At3g26010-like beta-propeller domain-containing protein n=1 Tax=Lupinus angustifolius TaxID=3871 RepID=A0A4P1RN89_LUPAN|nr:hypothetical protein TanjilG_33021 [Lupinus angustifolius]
MLMKGDACLFIQLDTVQQYNEEIELCPLRKEKQFSGVSNDILGFLSKWTRILDSCNGLILCRTTYKNPVELFVCNPSTQSWLSIPIPEHLQQNPNANLKVMLECGNEFLDSDDYKVINFEDPIDWESSSYYTCNVFHAKDGVWKTMEKPFFVGPRRMKFDMPVHYNGSLHFISDCSTYLAKNNPYFRPYVMSYNLENGTSSLLKLPNEARRGSHDLSCDMSIFKWSNLSSSVPQSICLVRLKKCVFTIWVLKDYESSSWYKIMKVRVKALGLKEKDPKVAAFTVMNGNILIFVVGKKVYSYGLNDENYMRLEEVGEHRCDSRVCFTSYSNTLRPCGTGATTMSYKQCYALEPSSQVQSSY